MAKPKYHKGQRLVVIGENDYHCIPPKTVVVVLKCAGDLFDEPVYVVKPLKQRGAMAQYVGESNLRPYIQRLAPQESSVLKWMLGGGAITLREALSYLGVVCLTKVISSLRAKGVPVDSERIKVPGQSIKVTAYGLLPKDRKWVRNACILTL